MLSLSSPPTFVKVAPLIYSLKAVWRLFNICKMLWKNKALNLYNFFPRKARIHLTSFSKLGTVQTNGSNFRSRLLLSNKIWQGSPEVDFPASELANLILKPFQLEKKDWAHFRRSLNHSAPSLFTDPCGLTLCYTAYSVVKSRRFCIMEESHKFCSWKGICHYQLFAALSGSWRGEISYCLGALFSQRLLTAAV